MQSRIKVAFIALVLIQAAHSTEEYATGLYKMFAPARLVSSLVSSDLATGFLIINAVLVMFGFWCYAGPVCRGWPVARGFAWFWVILELGNGIGHLLLAAFRGGYFPGIVTAPFLLVMAVRLGLLLLGAPRSSRRAVV